MFGLTYVTALILFLTSERSVPCLQFSLQAPPGLQLQVPLSSNCSLDCRGGYYQPESGRTPTCSLPRVLTHSDCSASDGPSPAPTWTLNGQIYDDTTPK